MTAAKFYEELEKTKRTMRWFLTNVGTIRAKFKNNQGFFCPKTAVAKYVKGQHYTVHDHKEADVVLKLNPDFANKVAVAADDSQQKSKTRKHLLHVLDLTEPSRVGVKLKYANKIVKNLVS